ncbi:hypothetical protein M422DRAFT_274911 [Sphaerobolus stellatus SS14]|uniref:Uncharacterized protein n=1 Tax=Sphaerobolus stellatus (strain SS14) TaxID=990650 RepID=A0A0C9UGK8_SPHS4|nr:hypothetical protein M422DRAFT_274911 [Sphaerobolus stellatus SS14]
MQEGRCITSSSKRLDYSSHYRPYRDPIPSILLHSSYQPGEPTNTDSAKYTTGYEDGSCEDVVRSTQHAAAAGASGLNIVLAVHPPVSATATRAFQ